jgi:microcystin-dependent protein
MAEPFLSEIRMMSFAFPPTGWALCNGQLLLINQNQALFALLGTTYGGNGTTNFALPDLQGRTPIHVGSEHTLGERGGAQAHALSLAELPTHTHAQMGRDAAGNSAWPYENYALAQTGPDPLYSSRSAELVGMHAGSVLNAGGSQAHPNMQPYLTISFCIALQGIFPSQN